jgi:hypothetical protein
VSGPKARFLGWSSKTDRRRRARSGDRGEPGPKLPWKIDHFVLASPFRSWSFATVKRPRSGSKSGPGRWSQWDEIGWVHYPEIGWSHSNEIRWVQSLEILHLAMICLLGFLCLTTGIRIRGVLLQHPKGLFGLHRGNAPRPP